MYVTYTGGMTRVGDLPLTRVVPHVQVKYIDYAKAATNCRQTLNLSSS